MTTTQNRPTEGQIQTLPSWPEHIKAQRAIPGTNDLIARTTRYLLTSFASFGTSVEMRLKSCAFFAVTTFPAEYRLRFAYDNAHIIAWVFAIDNLLDSCPSFDFAADLKLLVSSRLSKPLDAPLEWTTLPLNTDPTTPLPDLPYSLLMLVDNLQQLRRSLARRASDLAGLAIFDQVLNEQVLEAMLWETKWRLALAPPPTYEEYIAQGYLSICGNLCASTVNALLPNAVNNWQATYPGMEAMCYACRLINDGFTWKKEQAEGKPNALGLLAATYSTQEAELRLGAMVEDYHQRVNNLVAPYLKLDKQHPEHVLSYYIWSVVAVTRAMYSRFDFADPQDV